jgi:autotransporter adhesin
MIHWPRRPRRAAVFASCAFAAGVLALSSLPAFAGCESGPGPDDLIGTGCVADASGGSLATAVGNDARALLSAATAFGVQAWASAVDSAAIGAITRANGEGATAVGISATANKGATSVGRRSEGTGDFSVAIGAGPSFAAGAQAGGTYSVAIGGGDGADFTPTGGSAIDLNGAKANGFIATAVGTAAVASGGGSSAFGLGSRATADNSAAYGEFSTASANSSVAIGLFSDASNTSAVALGRSASATKKRSVALGSGSVANVADTVSVGSNTQKRRIMNVANAVAPNDAVNLQQAQSLAALAAARVAQASTGDAEDTKRLIEGLRQELADLRAQVRRQQAQLEGR